MNWKVIKSEAQYKKAVLRTMHLFHAAPGSPDAHELDLLLVLVKDYEDRHIVIPESNAIDQG